MRHHFAGVAGQFAQQRELLWRQVHLGTGFAHNACGQVDLDIIKAQSGGQQFRAGAVAQRSAHARQHFVGVERLGHIIIGAIIKRGNFLRSGITRRHPQYPRPERAQRRHEVEPVAIGQTKVEQRELWRFALHGSQCAGGICRLDHAIARAFKRAAQQCADRRFIVDHYHPD